MRRSYVWLVHLSLVALITSAACQSAPESTVPTNSPSASSTETPTPRASGLAPASPSTPAATASPYARRPVVLTDQAKPGSSFYEFRQQLRQAVKARDVGFIRAIADPKIKLTFGSPMTLDELEITNPQSLFWKRLERIINTGCTPYESASNAPNQPERWACPHVFQASVGDPYTDVYIVGEKVNVRAQPQANSPTIGVVSNEVVKSDSQALQRMTDDQLALMQTVDGWHPIITPQGRQGFVSSRFAYVPVGYRAIFEQQGGRWKMTVFIAGD